MIDPPSVRNLILMVPRVATDGMGAMIRIGQATAHLPPPPAPPAAAADSARGDSDEDEGEGHDHD